jgi:hypothetical protein
MSTRPLEDCKIAIDGREIRTVVSPYYGQFGISLWNDTPGAREHFSDLAPGSAALCDILQQQAGRAFEVDLLDRRLGSVDEYRGYAAADMGPCTRWITSLRFGLAHRNGRFAFRFDGMAGAVDPGTVFQGELTAFKRSSYRFHIAFEIANADLQLYVADAVALQAIQSYGKSEG